ncbi:MAG: Ribokinase [Anaerolineales bacterium]|nr:Ribokinase [Anaerolineales bacterium]
MTENVTENVIENVMLDIVTLGDLVADLIVPIPQLPVRAREHQVANDIAIEAGGTGNFLVIAARLGANVTALGTVGDDFYGEQVLELLAGEGVDVESVVVLPEGRTATAIVLVDDNAEHVFLGMFGSGQRLPFHSEWRRVIQAADAVFVTGYALHPDVRLSSASILTCLEIAHEHGIPVFFDMAPAAYHADREQISAVIDHTTVFLATLDETLSWTGAGDQIEAAQRLLTEGPSTVIVKLGDRGCLIATEEQQVHVEAFEVEVRDTAGAGDAFDAACVYGYLRGFSLEQIGALANAAGSASVARLGTGTRLPQKKEIEALLQTSSIAVPL